MSKFAKNITYSGLFLSIIVLFFAGGGLLVTILEEHVSSVAPVITLMGTLVVAAIVTGVYCYCKLLRSCRSAEVGHAVLADERKRIAFSVIFFILLVSITLAMMNFVASLFVPPWPMNGLHGVSSDVGKKAWLHYENKTDFVKANSWGQRDREHTVMPQSGVYRMVFVGDSFMEAGASVPLALRTEKLLHSMGMTSHEIINLGVSATDPDEYFFRLKAIGIPLKPSHCVMFFFVGNDFIEAPGLLSYGGVSATYPRWSFLQMLRLNALDHVISNERRGSLRAWFAGGDLLTHELGLKDTFGKTVDDAETEMTYLSFFPPDEQARLKSALYSHTAIDRHRFYKMLRRPDDQQFRSYYLNLATNIAKGWPSLKTVSIDYSFNWIKAAFELCQRKGVKFTLVVIPTGCTIDTRMIAQYSAVADMRAFFKPIDEAGSRLVGRATEAGMDVIDLRELLQKSPGAYLNMDGHWSQYGVDIVARYLAERLTRSTGNSSEKRGQ